MLRIMAQSGTPPWTLSTWDHLLWAMGFVGNLLLLVILFVRRRARQFPFFTAFIAGAVIRTAVLFVVIRHGTVYAYFLAYWSFAIAIDVVLQAAVVFGTASAVFRPLGYWAPDARRAMLWIVTGSVLAAAALTALATPVSPHWKEILVAKGSFFSSALMSELFVGMVALSSIAGFPWRTHVARVAHGLGVYSLADVLIETAHTIYGQAYKTHTDLILSHTRMVLYLLCLGYWSVTLWRRAPAMRALSSESRDFLRELQTRVAYDLYTLRSWKKP